VLGYTARWGYVLMCRMEMVPIDQTTRRPALQDGNLVSCHDNPIPHLPQISFSDFIKFLTITLYLCKVSSLMAMQSLYVGPSRNNP
jgi:hypothetical protein